MKHTYITDIDNGPKVECDCCGADYSESDECGGFLFGSHAYCPKCAVSRLPKIKEYGEEKYIVAHCPPGKPFRLWVLEDLRGGNNTTRIISRE